MQEHHDPAKCLHPGCQKRLPGVGGLFARARAAGWARRYASSLGTGFVCPDHRVYPAKAAA